LFRVTREYRLRRKRSAELLPFRDLNPILNPIALTCGNQLRSTQPKSCRMTIFAPMITMCPRTKAYQLGMTAKSR
jgi:hypothetical protein